MAQEERSREMSRMHPQKQSSRNTLPPWMQAEKISFGERFEICLYRLVSIFPVFVTFGLFSYLALFYLGVTIQHVNSIVLYISFVGRKFWYFYWHTKFVEKLIRTWYSILEGSSLTGSIFDSGYTRFILNYSNYKNPTRINTWK